MKTAWKEYLASVTELASELSFQWKLTEIYKAPLISVFFLIDLALAILPGKCRGHQTQFWFFFFYMSSFIKETTDTQIICFGI